MASRKRTKPLPVKNRHRKKSQEAVLKRINKIEDLIGFGAREKVVSSYFSTIYFLTRNRQAWGNSASYYHGSNFALNPEDLFYLAEKIRIEPGAKYEIVPETVLVVRGEKHSLAILFNWDLHPSLNKIDYGKKLTLAGAFKCIKTEDNKGVADVFASKHRLGAIAVDDPCRWSLVVSSANERAWKQNEKTTRETFFVSDAALRVMSFFNWPHSSW